LVLSSRLTLEIVIPVTMEKEKEKEIYTRVEVESMLNQVRCEMSERMKNYENLQEIILQRLSISVPDQPIPTSRKKSIKEKERPATTSSVTVKSVPTTDEKPKKVKLCKLGLFPLSSQQMMIHRTEPMMKETLGTSTLSKDASTLRAVQALKMDHQKDNELSLLKDALPKKIILQKH
jgi:hypothetical protein